MNRDPRFRKPLLYPFELREQAAGTVNHNAAFGESEFWRLAREGDASGGREYGGGRMRK